ncbi:Putative armadillo-like helical protein [Septoria linicola]|uniref:Armadillo-like helical protein n=1 Tax=Septoria linicola TaxID=215465 RepID=A0A9Q9EFY3_9PEZI|nr:putative armadillo-like helical protein [Septoria linicola]USW48359.1 Putative armadillo-like helical protein [Septoria linicola]
MSLAERLDKIRSSPKLQNQQQTSVVLNAIEDTLRTQKSEATATAYFAALLSLLGQYIANDKGIVNKEVASAVVYLLDLVTSHVPAPLLRSKFPQILSSLAPALTHPDAEAPLLRASIGCLESLLTAQDSQAWSLPQSSTSPRGAVGGLLGLAMDHRPKVRKRAQEALSNVLKHPPPSPSLDHPASGMCAETALQHLQSAAEEATSKKKKQRHRDDGTHDPGLMHALQLVKTVASAQNGWPSKKIDSLCELLLNISRGSNEFLTMAAFEIFEIIFAGMADEVSSTKLPRLLEIITELQPSQNDSQLLPPWIAVLSRGYDVSGQIEPEETFQKLPGLFSKISAFLASSSHNVRVSASECLISLLHTCIPDSVLLDPSIMDDKALEKIARTLKELLSVKYQTAWMEVFNVLAAAFEVLRWRSSPLLDNIVKAVGDLRGDDSFTGKKEADEVLSAAIKAAGPEAVLSTLPLNLDGKSAKGPGRAWLLPVMRDSVSNTSLAHFRTTLVPLSESMFQRVLSHGNAEKTMEVKIFETVVSQIWSCLPGYCQLPLDLTETFDQSFAEQLSNLLYQQPQMRTEICRGLQNLVDTNKAIAELEDEENIIEQGRVSRADAQKNLGHLAGYASNLLAVLFNVYSQTLPQNRGNLLQCINAYLSITPEQELLETFDRVAGLLETSLPEAGSQTQADKQKDQNKDSKNKMPPTSHTLMDLIITMSTYLPRQSFAGLFNMAANVVSKQDDPQLQKKAYKLIPRLSESEIGRQALADRNADLQQLLIGAADKVSAPARRDRLASIAEMIPGLPQSDLHFIPSIVSEVVISCKEVNEKARTAAFDLLVLMAEKMAEGGIVANAKVPHMSADAPDVPASLEEFFTMVSAGLAGSTPHMISASITALTRLLFEFHSRLTESTVADLVQTMDLFLTSNNREIVRSVLGFVKVCIISLPSTLVLPRLETLVPNLIVWSHEHKQHFKAKVKHIFERMIRRFGVEVVERYTPESDRKLIANIRKTRERRKKKRDAGEDDEATAAGAQKRSKFESEYDEAVYGSASESESDISDDEVLGRAAAKGQKAKQGGNQYIVEDEDEPLDLLDRKALAHVSSTKPSKQRGAPEGKKTKAKTDLDGKLVFNDNSDIEVDEFDGAEPGDGTLEGGINAYVEALKSKNAPTRGQKGKLKFKNVRDDDEMDVDEDDAMAAKKKLDAKSPRSKQQPQRRGLGGDKAKGGFPVGGKVQKSPGRGFKHGLQKSRGKNKR